MFNWLRSIRKKSPRQDFDKLIHIVSQIQNEHVERLGVKPELHPLFTSFCAEEGLAILPVDGEHPEGALRRQFHKYFGTRVFGESKLGKDMELEIGFIADPSLNAWATSRGNVDLIGVNSGLVIILDAAIRTLLSHPYLFPDVGDVTRCRPRVFPPEIGSLPLDSRMWRMAPLECSDRDELAQRIWSVALCYMIEHEFAHLWNGHADYVNESLGLARYDEVRDSAGDLNMQALELDADRSAATQVLRISLDPKLELSDGKIKWVIPKKMHQVASPNTLEICTLAACLFGIITSDIFEMNDLIHLQSTHPPAIVRGIGNLNEIALVLSLFAGQNQKSTLEMLQPVVDALITTVKAILPGGHWGTPVNEFADQVAQLIAVYDHRLSILRPELNRFKRGNLTETERPFYA